MRKVIWYENIAIYSHLQWGWQPPWIFIESGNEWNQSKSGLPLCTTSSTVETCFLSSGNRIDICPGVLAITWHWIWHLTLAAMAGGRGGHIWPILLFIHLCIILLATMLAPKVLNIAQKSALHFLSDILLKRTKDRVCRRQEFVGAETWSNIWFEGSFKRVWFSYLSFICMSYVSLRNLPRNEMTILSEWQYVWSAC